MFGLNKHDTTQSYGLVQLHVMGDNKRVQTITRTTQGQVSAMDYFKLFAYASFLSVIIGIIGGALYYVDLYLDPQDDDTTGRHSK